MKNKLILSLVVMFMYITNIYANYPLSTKTISVYGQLTEEQWTEIRNLPNLRKLDLTDLYSPWIPVGALQGSSIDSLIFPNRLDIIPTSFCQSCPNLKYVKFPTNKVEIRQAAFSNCPSLKDVTITGGADLSFLVFSQSGVTNLDIKGETTLNALSLNNTSSLTTIVIEDVQTITSVENVTSLQISPTVTSMTITTTSIEPKVLDEIATTVTEAQTTAPSCTVTYSDTSGNVKISTDVVTNYHTINISTPYIYISLKTGVKTTTPTKGEMYVVYLNGIKQFKTIL